MYIFCNRCRPADPEEVFVASSLRRVSLVKPRDGGRTLYVETLLPAIHVLGLYRPAGWEGRRRTLEMIMRSVVGQNLRSGRVMLGVYWNNCENEPGYSGKK